MDRFLKIIGRLTLIILAVVSSQFAFADLTKEDIEEIRVIVREEISREVNALRNEMNAKFERVDKQFEGVDRRFEDIDRRFEDIDKRFQLLYILLSSIIALIGIMVGAVLWLAKQDRPVTTKHYNEIMERESYLEKGLMKVKRELMEIKENMAEHFPTVVKVG